MEKVVGVIGGLGPKATLDFYSKVVDQTVASQDQDHLQVIINSNPKIPNRHTSIAGTGPSCIPSLIESARSLERAGADFLVMVCNTAHAYEDVIVSATNIPFISIISESVKACLAKKPGLSKVGLLAADGCLHADLYQEKFAHFGIDCVTPDETQQQALMSLIYRIKANETGEDVSREMAKQAEALIEQGAEIILAACTEVPLVLKADQIACPLISSTDVLVDSAISYAKRTRRPIELHQELDIVEENVPASTQKRRREMPKWDPFPAGGMVGASSIA